MRSVPSLLDPCADQLWCLQNCPGIRATTESRLQLPRAGLDKVCHAQGRWWQPQAREEWWQELAQPARSSGFQLHHWFSARESEKTRGFLHRIFGNFSWRNTGMPFNLLMRDKIWDGLQQSEFWESFSSHTDWPVRSRRYAEKEKHSHSSHSLMQFHTLRDRSRLFSHCDTWLDLSKIVGKVWVWLNALQFWRNQCEGWGCRIVLM